MIFSASELFAIKIVAVATPVAGLAAVVHVRARRRRARNAERARKSARSVIIEVRAGEAHAAGAVRIELTPHLLACLAAANSARLRGYPTPDSVMVAPPVAALWALRESEAFEAASKLIVTREFVTVRTASRTLESVRVPLRELLAAHHRLPEGRPLYCEAEGEIRSTPARALRAAPARAAKDFYWVRQGAAQAPAPARDEKRDI